MRHRPANLDGRPLEAIALRDRCRDDDSGFDTLYVDPVSHDAVAAIANALQKNVVLDLELRFVRAGAYVVPASLLAHAKGNGIMFWMDALVQTFYSNYGFSDRAPR